MRTDRCVVFLCLVSAAMPALGRGIHYGAITDAGVLACDERAWRGEQADECYAAIAEGSGRAAARAEAAWALNDPQRANEEFRRALGAGSGDHAAKVRWADLFAASHQGAEAMTMYQEVLAENPDDAFANLGAARVLVERFESEADAYLQRALNSDEDGARVAALLLLARVALEGGHTEQAAAALDDADELVRANGWPPLEIYALRAAADLLAGVTDSPWTRRALEYNPRFGAIHAVPAHFCVITRRYRAAIALYRKAVTVQPGLASAHEALGINLLRDNRITDARRHLELAHDLDPFSPVAVNSLRLLDSYSRFRLVDDRTPGEVPVSLRLREDEAAVIAPYAIRLVRDSIEEFTRRYGFELREPVVVEMYPDHEDFAVRTAGMPGLGILGATFGYVVAMDSPSGRAADAFQWGTTLWHEMAHVFTLEATQHLVPRWFSEGISVFEEWRSGPHAGVHIPLSVLEAMRDGRFLPVERLDDGFMRPTYEGQVIVSYMQAGLVCRFIEQAFGADGLKAVLAAFGEGHDTASAINEAFGITTSAFDERFASFIDTGYGEFLDDLPAYRDGLQSVRKSADKGDWKAVASLARELIEMQPGYVEPDSPYLALARAQQELGEADTAVLESFWRHGGYAPAALRRLADRLAGAGRRDDAIAVMNTVLLVDPLTIDVHEEFGALLLDAGRAADALREFDVVLALEPHDMATAWYNVARAQHALGDFAASQASVLQALDVAPGFRPAQKLLLQLARHNAD